MNWAIPVIVGTQLLFSVSDLMARAYMPKKVFAFATFLSTWFLAYFAIRVVEMFGQLYVFTLVELGKVMALLGAVSIMLANALALLVLEEVLSPVAYVGFSLAVIASIILNIS